MSAGTVPALSATRGALRHRQHIGWRSASTLIAAMVLLPVVSVLWLCLNPSENIWPHLSSTVLPRYLWTTTGLMFGVGIGVLVLGVSTAWLTTLYEFPGRRVLHLLLLLPLAIPAYVIAYLYTDLLEFAGPVQKTLRTLFDWQTRKDYAFPEIRSLGGAICMMSLVLYPYVYLMTRSSLLQISPRLIDVSRSLGNSPAKTFWLVILPIIRPGIVVGLALALMETLSDYGVVSFFAVQTLSAGIFDVWLNMGNLGGAAQISAVMMSFVVLLIACERLSRNRRQFYQSQARKDELHLQPLSGKHALLAITVCMVPVLLGFIIPITALVFLAVTNFSESWNSNFVAHAGNSLFLSVLAATIAVTLAVVVAYAKRLKSTTWSATTLVVAGFGYAFPGVVLAIGLLIPFAAFDNALDQFLTTHFGISTGLILSGTIFAIVCAYVIRFLAVAIGAVDSSLNTITPDMEMASRSIGNNASQTLMRIHLPLIKPGLLTAFVIVFVDCMKELPPHLFCGRSISIPWLSMYFIRLATR